MTIGGGEYAQAGVDYRHAVPFREAMRRVGRATVHFPEKRDVFVTEEAIEIHDAVFEYRGPYRHSWYTRPEGLGNKNWIAEEIYRRHRTKSYYDNIGVDVVLAVAHDVLARGALPVTFTFVVEANSYDWCDDKLRAQELAEGLYRGCQICDMAFLAGETAALRYLVNAKPPVKSAPVLSGSVTGIIAPSSRFISGARLQAGDSIIGAPSSGLHTNGAAEIIYRGLTLKPDYFFTKLPNGNTLGEEALIPTRSYVALIEALLEAEIDIHALLPGTGGGVSKLASDKRPLTYRVHTWVEVPLLFQFMRELGVSLYDCLTTFNWGVGYYIFVPPHEVQRVIEIGQKAGYELVEIGKVEDGARKVIFEPEGGITLRPPGE